MRGFCEVCFTVKESEKWHWVKEGKVRKGSLIKFTKETLIKCCEDCYDSIR